YHRANHRIQDVRVLSNGHILYEEPNAAAHIIDWTGEEVALLTANMLSIDSIHHEIEELPNGNWVTLGSELRNLGPYLNDENEEVNYDIVGDTIVEIDPTNGGSVVREHTFFDTLDPFIVNAGFNNPFWNNHYAEEAPNGTKDWTHGNAVIYDASDDSFIASLRHLDALCKVSRTDGSLIWTFGPEGDFQLEGDGEFAFHQHAPELTGPNRLIMYDNGNVRPAMDEGQASFSRVVEFQLDTSSEPWTAEQVWEYRGEESYFSVIVGDADLLGETVLITDGGMVVDPDLPFRDDDNLKWSRLREVTHTENPDVVFELVIRDDEAQTPVGYSIYRAELLEQLMP
ncbi:MAG: aryl-sulfate sulfotransferase, partial [Myxococcota bacterium]